MHLHHRTYKNLGNERLNDLVPLCPDCHDRVHALHRSDPRWKRAGLWAATKAARKRYGGNV
jgi:predicted HNH restriction endonuclease